MSDYYIPNNLIANVLLKLPFDSLIRCKSVSRSWRDLIESPFFIELHSKRSRLIIQQYPHPSECCKIVAFAGTVFYTFDSVYKVGSDSCRAIGRELKSSPLEFSERGLEIVGSCNGIICLWNVWTDDLALWNPWIQKHSALPSPPYEYTKKCRHSIHAAFGYDHVNVDYKVVKWYVFADFNADSNFLPSFRRYELCVYSMKLKSWRRIKGCLPFELPQYHYFFPRDCAVVNGKLHWLVTDCTRRIEDFMVAFDLGTEEFRKVSCSPCPKNPDYAYVYEQKLCSLNGCLCLLSYNYSSEERRGGDIWMMEDYGAVEASESCWTNLTSIEFPVDLIKWGFIPVAFSRIRRKIVLQIGWEKLVVYDLEKKSFRNVGINGDTSCSVSCVCVGSLIDPSS